MPIFIGLHISDERLYHMGMRFQQYDYKVVDLKNQHLTLLFIGDYKGVFLRNIIETLESIELLLPSILKPIEISLLPPGKYTNVVILVEKDHRLIEARRTIEDKLRRINIEIRDRYSFIPHVTIARKRKPPSSKSLNNVVLLCKRIQRFLPKFIVVRDVFLYETTKEGYKRILRLRAKWV